MPKRRSRGSGAVERLPSGRYRVRWRSLDGRYPSRSFTIRSDAERFLRQVIVDQEREGIGIQARSVTLGGIADAWFAVKKRSVKPRTVERYEDHIKTIKHGLGEMPISDVTFEVVQRFVAELPMAPKTVRGCYGVLSLILQHAARTGKLQRPISKPDLPALVKPKLVIPTRDEVDRLAAASDKRLWAPVILAGYCGLREGELLALHRQDVHLEPSRIGDDVVPPHVFVHHARNKTSGAFESTKTDGVRRVYLPDTVVHALREHLDEYPDGELVVPVSASVYQKSFERARRACGLDRVRPHDLRHAAASIMIAAGLSVKEVSEQLGHANATQTLDTYTHLWPHSWGAAIGRLNAYLAS